MAVLGSLVDITERKTAEQALKESEEGYKTLFESTEEGILVSDNATSKFVYANPAMCKMLGYTLEELAGMDRSAIHPAEEWTRIAAEIEAQAGGMTQMASNIPCTTRDGRTVYVDINATKALVNGRDCNIGFFRDITERKRIEEELNIKDRAIASSINAVVITDVNGVVRYVNDALLRMWGYTDQEAYGMNVVDLASSRDEALRIVSEVKERGFCLGESVARRKDGSLLDVQLSASLVTSSSGAPIAMFSTFVDITEHKRAEKALKEN
jgi:PAS domain S-box-containing protein